ncbi:MAG: TVP38/TMEM64 family protein [Candidatus Binatia bacterium]
MAAAWRWTPLADKIDLGTVTKWALSLRNNPARPLIILAAYLIGSLIMVPITILIIATALVFGPVLGTVYSFAGSLIGAGATYAVGYFLGGNFIRKMTGPKWQSFEQKIGRSGVLAVATLRLLPIAPFTIVNVISGAFQVPIRDYTIGSLLGLAPGIIVINLFAHQFESAIRNPNVGSFAILGGLIVISVLGAIWLRRRVARNPS